MHNASVIQSFDSISRMEEPTTAASQRYVSVLQSHRLDEEISRKQRSQRRARYVIGLTDSYRKSSDDARNRLLKEKATMRSQKEFSMLGQLAEITKWHEVIRANATSRQQVRDKNEGDQKVREQEHLETLKEHLIQTAERQMSDDSERWKALIAMRKKEREDSHYKYCRSLVEEAVGRAGDVIGYATEHDLPLPVTESIPTVLFEQWQRSHLPTDEQRVAKLMQDHVSLELYGHHGDAPHNPPFVTMMCKALSTLRPPAPPTRPQDPKAWPLILVTGPRYSGKSVVAENVANTLGMLYFSDQSLVGAALEELQQDFSEEDLADPVKSELVDLGYEIQQTILAGNPIAVSLMAKLVGHCVRNAPEDCSGIIIDGAQITVDTVKAIEAILSGLHDPVEEETMLLAPKDLNAPEELTTHLNVSRPMTAITEIAATQSREKAKGGAKKNRKEEDEPLPPIDIPALFTIAPLTKTEAAIVNSYKSSANVLGIAKIVTIECSADQLFDRVAKIRFDFETGEEYHLDFNPPPEDRLAFLQIRDRPDQDCGNMFAQIESYADQWAPTAHWLEKFDGIKAPIESSDLGEMIESFQNIALESAEQRRVYCHTVAEAQRIIQHREELQAQQLEHNKRRDAAKRQLLATYMERQVDPLPSILTEPDWAATQPVEMSPALAGVLIDTLSDFTKNYSATVNETHEALNVTLTAFHEHNDQCAGRFELYWKQSDSRQEMVDAFLQKDLELDRNLYYLTATKEELHYRLDTLQAELWKLVDGRKTEAAALIEQLCAKTTIVEAVNEAIRGLGSALLQCEFDRFLTVRHLVLTYFSVLKDGPVPMDLADILPSDVIPQLKGGLASEKEAEQAAPTGKNAPKKAPPKKGKGAIPTAEETERPQEDMLIVVKAKAIGLMDTLIDKLTILSLVPVKAKKGVVEVTRAEAGSAGALATPVVEGEKRAAEARMQAIVDYFNGIADNVIIAQTSLMHTRLMASLQQHYLSQLAAVNAVITYLRDRVEREVPPTHRLLLDLESFAVDEDTLLFPKKEDATAASSAAATPTPDDDDALDAKSASSEEAIEDAYEDPTTLTSCLTLGRLATMITLFKVCAPDYRLHKKDFIRIVKQADYVAAGEEVVDVPELFDRFDDWNAGLIDWRLFVVHLLFWCEPYTVKRKEGEEDSALSVSQISDDSSPFAGPSRNKYYVDGPNLLRLLDLRGDLGDEPVDEDTFVNADHFFGNSMEEDDEDDERFRSYCSALWEAFSVNDTLDPYSYIMFLCPDEQPLRGMQKAFLMVTPTSADDSCPITQNLLDKIFHTYATNPRSLGVWDPTSVSAQAEIFQAVGTNSFLFQDMCGTHAGRVILNNSTCFQRKSFVK